MCVFCVVANTWIWIWRSFALATHTNVLFIGINVAICTWDRLKKEQTYKNEIRVDVDMLCDDANLFRME